MQIVAHRGYSHKFLENTLVAFEEAIVAGTDMIETDIRLSEDGIPVIFHDDSFKRLAHQDGSIEQSTLEEIQNLVLTAKGKADGSIPTLAEVLQCVAGRCMLILEIKEEDNKAALCEAVAAMVEDSLEWIEVSCFDDGVLELFHAINPKIRLHKLIDKSKVLQIENFDHYYAYIAYFDIAVSLRQHPKVKELLGKSKVIFWTVGDEDISEAVDLGLYGAMSNDPLQLQHYKQGS